MTQPTDPRLPQDVERVIAEALLREDPDMAGTMSRVAPRFRTWAKSETLRTVVIRQVGNWTQRISELFLPNANLIQTLAIDLPSTLCEEELLHIQRLLQAAERVRHLAVGWPIWQHFAFACGSLQLKSLCLIWDGACQTPSPSLRLLQHPSSLRNLAIYAPPRPTHIDTRYSSWAQFHLPATIMKDFPNLASLAYAARSQLPDIWGCTGRTESRIVMHTWTLSGSNLTNVYETAMEAAATHGDNHREFSTAYLRCSREVLVDWLRKLEGRPDSWPSLTYEWSTRGARRPTEAELLAWFCRN
ncbi:hypothetical protein DFH06DRAFT_1324793 [Mycena polygramma]|nr:hypothetical protein DFH06DRAFT_1324793 [Mycena polygramma]